MSTLTTHGGVTAVTDKMPLVAIDSGTWCPAARLVAFDHYAVKIHVHVFMRYLAV